MFQYSFKILPDRLKLIWLYFCGSLGQNISFFFGARVGHFAATPQSDVVGTWLSMQKHISSICCASFLELQRITSIRPYLSQSAAARLVVAVVISHLDYCNSVFIGLPADKIARLQRVQNNAAQPVKKRRRDHVTPLLKELHWLPVKFHCQYKIATLAYRHFDGSLPPYLSSSLCTYEPSRSLRSSNEKLLKIPKRNLRSFGQRSFSFMAPSLWNSLPATLRNVPTLSQFKSQLKTFLFAQAFL